MTTEQTPAVRTTAPFTTTGTSTAENTSGFRERPFDDIFYDTFGIALGAGISTAEGD